MALGFKFGRAEVETNTDEIWLRNTGSVGTTGWYFNKDKQYSGKYVYSIKYKVYPQTEYPTFYFVAQKNQSTTEKVMLTFSSANVEYTKTFATGSRLFLDENSHFELYCDEASTGSYTHGAFTISYIEVGDQA